jgi:hypothetical protein
MPLPLSSRSTQIGIQKRFPVIEFEPHLDAIEAASLLRMHPKTLKKKARLSARNLVRKVQRKDFSGPSVNAELRPWEPGPSLASLKCDPSKMREFQQKSE